MELCPRQLRLFQNFSQEEICIFLLKINHYDLIVPPVHFRQKPSFLATLTWFFFLIFALTKVTFALHDVAVSLLTLQNRRNKMKSRSGEVAFQ